MKKQTILNGILIAVIGVLLFYIRISADSHQTELLIPVPSPGPASGCAFDQIGGFAQAVPVQRTTAGAYAAAYQTFAERNSSTTLGGVISKAALDSLFCGGNYNGLAYRLAMDPSGKFGPANAVFIVIGGVNVQNNSIVSQSGNYYTTNLWCPPSCMTF